MPDIEELAAQLRELMEDGKLDVRVELESGTDQENQVRANDAAFFEHKGKLRILAILDG